MLEFIKRHHSKALVVSLVGSVFALAASFGSAFFAYELNSVDKTKQVRLDEIAKFDQSSADLISAGGSFVVALNNHKNLAETKISIQEASNKQVIQLEKMRLLFKGVGKFDTYYNAVIGFNKTVQITNEPVQIGNWIESFDKLVVSKGDPTSNLYESVGVNTAADKV